MVLPLLGTLGSLVTGGALPATGFAVGSSIWGSLATMLGGAALSSSLRGPGGVSTSGGSVGSLGDTSTRVQRSPGYQGAKKKSQLEILLSQIAGKMR